MRLGLSKKEALHEMAGRCDLEDMYLFTRLGTSMGKALVEQADNMRERYRQRIKAEILFPLILLIFPSVFIIILLPPIINILNHLDIMP